MGGVDNYVYALDGTRGFVKWQYLTRGRVHSGATVSSDGSMVYIGADDSTVYAISTAQVPQDGSAHAAVALLLLPDGASGWVGLVMVVASLLLLLLCCCSSDVPVGLCANRCLVFPPQGKAVWKTTTGGQIYSSPALSSDGSTLYVGSHDNSVYALSAATGAVQWSFATKQVSASPSTRKPSLGLICAVDAS